MRAETIIAVIILALVAGIYLGSEDIDEKVQAEFDYRYQN